MKLCSIFLFVATLATLNVGCSFWKTATPEEKVAYTVPTTVAEWLTQAPAPTMVLCSVDSTIAPEAVSKFNAISSKVASIYSAVHAYAQEDKDVSVDVPQLDAATIDAAINTALTAEDGAVSAGIQDAITTKFQSTIAEVEAQQKAINDYIQSLRTSESIMNITNPVQKTTTLMQLGSDVKLLEEQLAAAAKGASLILRERVDAIQKK